MAELLCVLQVFRRTSSCRSPGCSKIHFVVNTFFFTFENSFADWLSLNFSTIAMVHYRYWNRFSSPFTKYWVTFLLLKLVYYFEKLWITALHTSDILALSLLRTC